MITSTYDWNSSWMIRLHGFGFNRWLYWRDNYGIILVLSSSLWLYWKNNNICKTMLQIISRMEIQLYYLKSCYYILQSRPFHIYSNAIVIENNRQATLINTELLKSEFPADVHPLIRSRDEVQAASSPGLRAWKNQLTVIWQSAFSVEFTLRAK